jgi:5'-nucleotidase
MRRKITVMAVFTFIVLLLHSAAANASTLKDGDRYTLTILHTNDIHGHVDNLPRFSTVIKNVKKDVGKNLLILDVGDVFLRGEFQDFLGMPEIEILNEWGCEAMAFGNNDFRIPPSGGSVEDGNKQLSDMKNTAKFPILCANVTVNGGYMEQVEPYIIKNINGVNVGIIGITSMKPQLRGWTEVADKVFESGEITLKKLLPEVSEKSDVNIILSHAGLVVDTYMVSMEGVSAVIGADDHFVIEKPIYYSYDEDNPGMKGAPIVQNGGEHFHYLGRLDLVFEKIGGKMKLADFEGSFYDLERVEEDENVVNIIEKYRRINEEKRLKPAA